jgi:hypothetical protein
MDNYQSHLDLAVTLSEQRIKAQMDKKLDEHREAIEHRLDNQDEKLDSMRQDLSALVGTDKVDGLIQRNTEMLEGLVEKHERWHEEDTAFRQSITTQVSKLAKSQDKQAADLRAVRWLISVCGILGKIASKVIATLVDSGNLLKVLGIVLLWLAGWHWHALLAWLHRLF